MTVSRPPTMPFGWFRIGYSDEFPSEQIRPLHYFGRELVAWRPQGSKPRLADAFCPHMGAHLGYGGTVVGDHIACPFHKWEFGADGFCARVPYNARGYDRARLRMYPVCEQDGMVWAWYHEDETAPPQWEVPVIDGWADRWVVGEVRYLRPTKCLWYDAGENLVDMAHRPVVHGVTDADDVKFEEDGHRLRLLWRLTYDATRIGQGVIEDTVSLEVIGPGMTIMRHNAVVPLIAVCGPTPIDDQSFDLRMTYAMPVKDPDSSQKLFARMFVRYLLQELEHDAAVWDHKAYLDRPCLLPEDGPIMQLRRWATQFRCQAPAAREPALVLP